MTLPKLRAADLVARSRFIADYAPGVLAQGAEFLAAKEAGLVDDSHVVGEIGQVFAGTLGRLEGGERPVRDLPAVDVEPRVVLDDPTEQVHIAMGWRGVDHHDDDRYALMVANQILGGGMSSRLFQQVREERGLCYSVYSWASTYADAGSAGIYAGTAPSRVGELLRVVDDEVARVNAGLARVETIKRFAILPKRLHHEDGEVTATLKVKRSSIAERYADLIEELYA